MNHDQLLKTFTKNNVTIEIYGEIGDTRYYAIDKETEEEIGALELDWNDPMPIFLATHINVNSDYRRMGVATALHDVALSVLDDYDLQNYFHIEGEGLTDEGKALYDGLLEKGKLSARQKLLMQNFEYVSRF